MVRKENPLIADCPHLVCHLQVSKILTFSPQNCAGALVPAFSILFGNLVNAFGDPEADLQGEVNK